MDDPDWRNPYSLGCSFFADSPTRCHPWKDMPWSDDLHAHCPRACGVCGVECVDNPAWRSDHGLSCEYFAANDPGLRSQAQLINKCWPILGALRLALWAYKF